MPFYTKTVDPDKLQNAFAGIDRFFTLEDSGQVNYYKTEIASILNSINELSLLETNLVYKTEKEQDIGDQLCLIIDAWEKVYTERILNAQSLDELDQYEKAISEAIQGLSKVSEVVLGEGNELTPIIAKRREELDIPNKKTTNAKQVVANDKKATTVNNTVASGSNDVMWEYLNKILVELKTIAKENPNQFEQYLAIELQKLYHEEINIGLQRPPAEIMRKHRQTLLTELENIYDGLYSKTTKPSVNHADALYALAYIPPDNFKSPDDAILGVYKELLSFLAQGKLDTPSNIPAKANNYRPISQKLLKKQPDNTGAALTTLYNKREILKYDIKQSITTLQSEPKKSQSNKRRLQIENLRARLSALPPTTKHKKL